MLLTHMKDLAVRHICPAQSNGGEGKKASPLRSR